MRRSGMADEDRVSVVARITARRGMEEQLREETEALVKPTRSEAGCLNYDLHQSIEEPWLLFFYENWRSRQDLDEHLKKPHIIEWLEKTENLREGLEIERLKMVSTPNVGTAGILKLLLLRLRETFPLRPLQRIFGR
jgi:quinol monooxygenase YgiN